MPKFTEEQLDQPKPPGSKVNWLELLKEAQGPVVERPDGA